MSVQLQPLTMDTETDGRRERGEQTRERILAAALELFAENGYAATSVAMVAKLARVHSQSLYHAFGSKEGLLAAAMERAAAQFFDDLQAAVHAPDEGQSVNRLEAVLAGDPPYLRLHLVLILERRGGEPELLERAAEIRRQGRELAAQLIAPAVADLPDELRARALDDLSHLLIMLLDGAFIERQVNDDAEQLGRLLRLVGAAMYGALQGIVADASSEST